MLTLIVIGISQQNVKSVENKQKVDGFIGVFTETELYEYVCNIANFQLQNIKDQEVTRSKACIVDAVFNLISVLDLHGDETTEAMYTMLDNYIKSSKRE